MQVILQFLHWVLVLIHPLCQTNWYDGFGNLKHLYVRIPLKKKFLDFKKKLKNGIYIQFANFRLV